MSSIDISVCRADETGKLQQFIHNHWRENHVFVTQRDLLLWQHADPAADLVNFIVAREEENQEIVGCLGFVSTARFDPTLKTDRDYWWAMFKVRDENAGQGVGKKIIQGFEKTQSPATIGGIGLSDMVIPIYKKLGFRVGRVNHYYMLNPRSETHQLVQNPDDAPPPTAPTGRATITQLISGDEILQFGHRMGNAPSPQRPHKSPQYFVERYNNHPWYDYQVFGLQLDDTALGLLATRTCSHGGADALRLVDYWGRHDALRESGTAFAELLRNSSAEYLDVYNLGIAPDVFTDAGFTHRPDDSATVIPNYYEPFEQRNVNLDFMYRNDDSVEPYVIFKGDSDQDRPSFR